MSSIRRRSEVGSERVKEGWIGVMQVDMLVLLRTQGEPRMSHQD